MQCKSTERLVKPASVCLIETSRCLITDAECRVDWLSAAFSVQ